MQPRTFFSLPASDGRVAVFCLLERCSGKENVVDTFDQLDLRDAGCTQRFTVWRAEGAPPTRLSVYPLAEPEYRIVRALSDSWLAFREGLLKWDSAEATEAVASA